MVGKPNQPQQPFSPSFNFNQAPAWGGRYPWTPNFKFPTNPAAQVGKPQVAKADVSGIQQAMQKRSAQDNDSKRLSSAGEKSGVTFKHDNEGHATGQSAFDTLDGYMKKAGLNSFQTQFFTRLIEQGMNESQIKHCIKKAGIEFGEKVASELNSGFEKLAFAARALPWLGRMGANAAQAVAPKLFNYGARQVAQQGLGEGLKQTAQFAGRQAFKGARKLTTGKGLYDAGNALVNNPGARSQLTQGAITGAINPYTGAHTWVDEQGNFDPYKAVSRMGGAMLGSRALGQTGMGMQRRALIGEGAGAFAGGVGNMLGLGTDMESGAQLGFGLGAISPSKLKHLVPRESYKAMSPGVRKFLSKPLVTNQATGLLNKVDPIGTYVMQPAMNFASGLSGNQAKHLMTTGAGQAGKFLRDRIAANPGQAAMIGGGALAGAGGIAAPFMASRAVQNASNEMQKNMMPFMNYATETMSNVNNAVKNPLGTMMGNVGDYLQQNPTMAMALLGGLGAAGGGLMGGGTGATLGGIGLPLAYMMASGQNPFQSMMGGRPNVAQTQAMQGQAGENNAALAGVRNPMAQLPTRAQENELQRQQQMQQQGTPVVDQAATHAANQAAGLDPQQIMSRITPDQMQVLQDPSIPEELKMNILRELAGS